MIIILERYGWLGMCRLVMSVIYTKLFFRNARLIRLPFDIRNQQNIRIGDHFTSGFGCRLEAHPLKSGSREICLFIGRNVEINDYVHIAAGKEVRIGDNVLIASKVFISDINHGTYTGADQDSPLTPPNSRALSSKPVIISDNVWLGEGVCIMAGVKIGAGSIIGAGSVVTKDIPANCIAVGSPAKVVKEYCFSQNGWISVEKK